MKVYLSSTLNDLGPERLAVKEALGGECTVVESYTADERSVRESCLADVAGCDLYIGIVGLRYGFVPTGQTCSITELEYREARERKVPTLVFVKDEDEIRPRFHDAVTRENPRERIEALRNTLTTGTDDAARASLFKTPEDLKAHVLKAYLRYSSRQVGPKPKPIEGRPYPGLRAFLPTEADRFFGRDAEVESLIERIVARGERFLALIGPSGSGKSSLVYAGLIPRLTASVAVAGTRWFPVTFAPRQLGDDPFVPLAAALAAQFPDPAWRAADLAQRLRQAPADIAVVARQALGMRGASGTVDARGPDGTGAQILLFVDQFEELFASKVDAGASAAFFALLRAAVECPLLRVVTAMRSDFYAQWPQDEASIALLGAGHFPVAVPGAASLEKMIVGPAQAAGLRFEPPGLAQRILEEAGTALALAEFALAQLYERRQGYTLTAAAYLAIGGVAGVVEGLAEEAVAGAEQALRSADRTLDDDVWSRLFLAIAGVEDQGQELAVVRRRATAAELPGAALTLAQHLVDKRLLVSGGGSGGQAAFYEVGHEAVFSHWARFNEWYGRYADDLAMHRQVERAAADWHRAAHSPLLAWRWERQRPALEALRKLNHLALPPDDPAHTDAGLATWRALEARLPEPPLRTFLHPEPLLLLAELESGATAHQRREEIGLRLAQMGDPRRGVGLDEAGLPQIEWVDVPEGVVQLELDAGRPMWSDSHRAPSPMQTFKVKSFKLARYPITWSQYRAFLEDTDGNGPNEARARWRQWAFPNYPVINVSWGDAIAYCAWLRSKLGHDDIRLPTEWEWYRAAVGDTNQEYPWPDASDQETAKRANTSEARIGRTTSVGMYPLGRSPFGIDDMAGNVSEWCLNTYDGLSTGPSKAEARRALRGGSWLSTLLFARSVGREGEAPGSRYSYIGMRVCRAQEL